MFYLNSGGGNSLVWSNPGQAEKQRFVTVYFGDQTLDHWINQEAAKQPWF